MKPAEFSEYHVPVEGRNTARSLPPSPSKSPPCECCVNWPRISPFGLFTLVTTADQRPVRSCCTCAAVTFTIAGANSPRVPPIRESEDRLRCGRRGFDAGTRFAAAEVVKFPRDGRFCFVRAEHDLELAVRQGALTDEVSFERTSASRARRRRRAGCAGRSRRRVYQSAERSGKKAAEP